MEGSSERNTAETGSLITMTSDERVQIFVPSPSGGGTPYSTITKSSNQEFLHKVQAAGSNSRPTTTSISWHEMTSDVTSSTTVTSSMHKPAPLADAETLTSTSTGGGGAKSLEELDHRSMVVTSAAGDTLVDSELPSLPTDGVVVTSSMPEQQEPVSLSDISLTIVKSSSPEELEDSS